MKKTISVCAIVMLALGSSACSQETKELPPPEPPVADTAPVAMPDAEKERNVSGIYSGTIPSASGSGIEVTITLRSDSTYTVVYHYAEQKDDDGDGDYTTSGTFRLDEDKGILTLDAKDLPPYYRVGKDRLTQLDMEGAPITGELADDYVLLKKTQ
jgi:uncharacterized lipoprotein NlpE involved in copper resistance